MNLLEQMHILADADYRLFQIRLMPSVDAGRVLGVRMPDLRDLAKKQKNRSTASRYNRRHNRKMPNSKAQRRRRHGYLDL